MKINLSENIRKYRKAMALTQEELAEAMGVTVGAVHKWETGASTPEIGLIVSLANFFDTSVDILLGYEMQDNRIEAVIDRINLFLNKRDRRCLTEADQALAKYPNSFGVVLLSAVSYFAFGIEENKHSLLRHALELYKNAEKLISQNTNPRISIMTIQGDEALIYFQLGAWDRALECLEKNNAGGYYDDLIGTLYSLMPDKMEQAAQHSSSALLKVISDLQNALLGHVKVYVARKEYDMAEQFLDWVLGMLKGLQKGDDPDFLDRKEAQYLVCRAYIQNRRGQKKAAKKSLRDAIKKAEQFDKKPDFDLRNLRFLEMLREGTSYDLLGDDGIKGLEYMLKLCGDEELNTLWAEIREQSAE